MRWFDRKKEEAKVPEGETLDPNLCPECRSKRILSNSEGFAFLVCTKCRMLHLIPPITKTYQIFIGKTLTNVDREGYLRMHVEYPLEKRGIQIIRMKQYVEDIFKKPKRFKPIMKDGDKLAFACDGSDEHGIPYAIYYHNLTMGTVRGALSKEYVIAGRLRFEHPNIVYAERYLSKTVTDYQNKLSELSHEAQEPTVTRGTKLEEVVMQLFEKMGFEDVRITGGASDKGIDLECFHNKTEGGKHIIAQCKHQSLLNKVKPTQVRDFAHVLEREKEKQPMVGYFITSSYFSPECYLEENCGKDMELIDRDHLEKLLARYGMSLDSIEKVQ